MRHASEGWVLLGWLFGYPKCCVEYFSTGQYIVDDRPPRKILQGTGFIACPVCEVAHTAEEMVEIINANRKVPFAFGDERSMERDFHDGLGDLLLEVLFEDRTAAVPPVAERGVEASPSPH